MQIKDSKVTASAAQKKQKNSDVQTEMNVFQEMKTASQKEIQKNAKNAQKNHHV